MANNGATPLSSSELSGFCAQMAMILKAGVSAREGLLILRDDARDGAARALLARMFELSEQGLAFCEVLRQSGAFPKYLADMAEIGEQSGRLDEVLESLTDYYAREQNISASVRGAVTYPLIMLVMMMLVIAVLSIQVLPVFAQVFSQLGAQVSVFAQGVLRLGGRLGTVSAALVAALAVVSAALAILQRSAAGRRALTRFFAVFWPTRRLSAKIALGRFAGAMSLMLSSGMDADRSLEMAGRLVDNPVVTRRIADSRRRIDEGGSFAEAVAQSGVFSGVSARMISVGFRTGSVDLVMKKLADRCEEEIDAELSALVGIVEPTLVSILSVAVGMILLSVMLPLMGIMSTIG
jgi:type IV pilus assembly protein PilC